MMSLIDPLKKKLRNDGSLINCIYILKNYSGSDWEDYVKVDVKRYNRELVYRDDDLEILVLTWDSQQTSGIHDHPSNGCVVKILSGELNEEVYTTRGKQCCRKLKKDSVNYQEGIDGIHNIINVTDNISVSLHIYSPPNYYKRKS